MNSVILIEGEKYFVRSSAALRIAKNLTPFWRLFCFLVIIPAPVRDLIYNIVAENRYRIFGKRNSCRVPAAEEKDKFIL